MLRDVAHKATFTPCELGTRCGLQTWEMNNIIYDHRSDPIIEQRYQIMIRWKQIYGEGATYERFVAMLSRCMPCNNMFLHQVRIYALEHCGIEQPVTEADCGTKKQSTDITTEEHSCIGATQQSACIGGVSTQSSSVDCGQCSNCATGIQNSIDQDLLKYSASLLNVSIHQQEILIHVAQEKSKEVVVLTEANAQLIEQNNRIQLGKQKAEHLYESEKKRRRTSESKVVQLSQEKDEILLENKVLQDQLLAANANMSHTKQQYPSFDNSDSTRSSSNSYTFMSHTKQQYPSLDNSDSTWSSSNSYTFIEGVVHFNQTININISDSFPPPPSPDVKSPTDRHDLQRSTEDDEYDQYMESIGESYEDVPIYDNGSNTSKESEFGSQTSDSSVVSELTLNSDISFLHNEDTMFEMPSTNDHHSIPIRIYNRDNN